MQRLYLLFKSSYSPLHYKIHRSLWKQCSDEMQGKGVKNNVSFLSSEA